MGSVDRVRCALAVIAAAIALSGGEAYGQANVPPANAPPNPYHTIDDSLAMDSKGRLFVADRSNNRIQIFNQDGAFLEEWKQFGRPSGVFIDKNDLLYASDSLSTEANNPGGKRGIRIGSVTDGKVVAFISEPYPDGIGEGIVTDAKGNLYSALTTGQALKKYVKH